MNLAFWKKAHASSNGAPPAGTGSIGAHGRRLESDPYAFQVAHRRLAWCFRLVSGCFMASVVANVMLVATVKNLVPLKTTDIVLVRENQKTNQIYRIEPFVKGEQGFDVAMEAMAVRYIRNMLEIDRVTQDTRFAEAFAMTDIDFLKKFHSEHIDTKRIQEALKSGLTRSIIVESAHKMDSKGNQQKYAVDFIQIDKRDGVVIDQKQGRAFVHMDTRAKDVKAIDRYENPLGIVVLDMVVKEKATK